MRPSTEPRLGGPAGIAQEELAACSVPWYTGPGSLWPAMGWLRPSSQARSVCAAFKRIWMVLLELSHAIPLCLELMTASAYAVADPAPAHL